MPNKQHDAIVWNYTSYRNYFVKSRYMVAIDTREIGEWDVGVIDGDYEWLREENMEFKANEKYQAFCLASDKECNLL